MDSSTVERKIENLKVASSTLVSNTVFNDIYKYKKNFTPKLDHNFKINLWFIKNIKLCNIPKPKNIFYLDGKKFPFKVNFLSSKIYKLIKIVSLITILLIFFFMIFFVFFILDCYEYTLNFILYFWLHLIFLIFFSYNLLYFKLIKNSNDIKNILLKNYNYIINYRNILNSIKHIFYKNKRNFI